MNDWLSLKTDPALLERIRNAPPASAADIAEQRVSWVFGMTGISKDQIRAALRPYQGGDSRG